MAENGNGDGASGPVGGARALLTRRLGPLPVWGWAAAAAGAVGVGLYLRRRQGAQVTGAGGNFGDLYGGLAGGDAGGGGGGGAGPVTPIAPDTPPAAGPLPAPPSSIVRDSSPSASLMYSADAPGSRGTLSPQGVINVADRLTQNLSDLLSRPGAPIASGQSGYAAINQEVADRINRLGGTAAVINDQVYAARDAQTFFYGIPQAARENLAQLLVGMERAGTLPEAEPRTFTPSTTRTPTARTIVPSRETLEGLRGLRAV